MPENRDPLKVRAGRTRRFEGHALTVHRHSHPDPSHHIGSCSPDDRAGRSSHVHREGRHIYDGASSGAAKRAFIRQYGPRKGPAIYGATIGLRKRQLLQQRSGRRVSYKFSQRRAPIVRTSVGRRRRRR